MAQLLALEWNSAEARVAVASLRGSQVVVEHAFAIPLRPPQAEGAEVNVGERIAAALSERGISRGEALVAVGRTNITLRELVLPAVPDDELPEMVRLQATREFSELTDAWLLDYLPIDDLPDLSGGAGGATAPPRNVLAAAIGPELVEQIQAVCQTAGLRPKRMVLRACAAASLWTRAKAAQPDRLRLLVDLQADEADLTAMIGRKVVFMRTMRLIEDTSQPQVLVGEIRRTMAAVQNRLGGRKVESVVLCGTEPSHAALAEMIRKELGSDAELFDPFDGLPLGRGMKEVPPGHPGRYAPLLGLLTAELEQTGQAIDFLHPRRPPPPPDRRKRWIAGGVAAAALAVIWLGIAKYQHGQLLREVRELEAKSKALDGAVSKADKARQAEAEISKWADNEVIWLDQLQALCEDLPPVERAYLTQLTCSPATSGGEMRLRGLANKADTIGAVEEAMRKRSRHVLARDSREDSSTKGYHWRFETSVFVSREPSK